MDPIYIDPAQICRAFFVLASAAALGANSIPLLRQWFISYGARSLAASPPTAMSHQNSIQITSTMTSIAQMQVPHSWFTHYYITSVLSSILWAFQLSMGGFAFRFLASYSTRDAVSSITMNQVAMVWTMMMLQGCRRLYECVKFLKPSISKMPVTSWALGIAFYLVVGISVWVEGIPALLDPFEHISLARPSLKTLVAVPLFLSASRIQHDCHMYLSNLKKYTLPKHSLFRQVICPHYTAECVIYLALAIMAAPEGRLLNTTILTTLLFTATNLAITAESTRCWYSDKFGADMVKDRWRMIPFLY